jgi:Mg-chelatase subunit ChlD
VVKVGLIAFSGKAEIIVPMRAFDRAALEAAVDRVQIGNATAIGDAMVLGSQELLKAGVENKALIVLTDGENNRGVRPELVVQALRKNWNKAGVLTDDVKVFLLAYDIEARIFEGVKQAGATVVESKDNAALQRILRETVEEVLLEKPR